MPAGETELREFFARQLASGETLVACAYGIERRSAAERLARWLSASAGSWIGGALEADSGWGLATTATRLFTVRVRRLRRLFRGEGLAFDSLESHSTPRDLGATVERVDREVVVSLMLGGHARRLVFVEQPGFDDNVQQAAEIARWLT